MFGECCFQTGDVKLTMGTGTFLDINTGNNPQQSVGGKELEFILFVNEISFFFHSLNFYDTTFLFYIKDIL